jgi:cytochrome P450
MSLDQLDALVSRTEIIQAWIRDQFGGARRDDEPGILLAVRLAVDAGTLGTAEATTILHTLLSAGGESTSSLLGNAVRLLAEDGALQQWLRKHPGDVQVFVEEALRVESPFRQMMRYVPRDTMLGGVDIAAGSTALLLFGAGNRDPAEFDKPDAIDLTRGSPRHHLAFGQGIHYCVGAALARMEARIVITALLERTQSFALDPDRAPRWVDSLLVRRHERLPLLVRC